jgi:hypothetical protein
MNYENNDFFSETKSEIKHYMNVPYSMKDEAKSLGAKWDMNKKSWYYMDNMKYKEQLIMKFFKSKEEIEEERIEAAKEKQRHREFKSNWFKNFEGNEEERKKEEYNCGASYSVNSLGHE